MSASPTICDASAVTTSATPACCNTASACGLSHARSYAAANTSRARSSSDPPICPTPMNAIFTLRIIGHKPTGCRAFGHWAGQRCRRLRARVHCTAW
jgi:hypothetical protein